MKEREEVQSNTISSPRSFKHKVTSFLMLRYVNKRIIYFARFLFDIKFHIIMQPLAFRMNISAVSMKFSLNQSSRPIFLYTVICHPSSFKPQGRPWEILSIDDYRKIVRLFREEEVPHHTFPLPSERNIHAVVRGVPVNFSDTEIKGELEQRGYSPLHIIRLKRSGGAPMPLVVVILPKTEKSQQVFNEHELLGLAIRVEVQKNSRLIGQCHRCQKSLPPSYLKATEIDWTNNTKKKSVREKSYKRAGVQDPIEIYITQSKCCCCTNHNKITSLNTTYYATSVTSRKFIHVACPWMKASKSPNMISIYSWYSVVVRVPARPRSGAARPLDVQEKEVTLIRLRNESEEKRVRPLKWLHLDSSLAELVCTAFGSMAGRSQYRAAEIERSSDDFGVAPCGVHRLSMSTLAFFLARIMVFNYKRKTERAQGWDENIMNRAINAINQKGTSIRGAALQFRIPYPTLRKHFLKQSSKKQLGRFRPVFSGDMEQQLVQHIQEMDARFYGLTKQDLCSLAFEFTTRNNVPHNFRNGSAGEQWYSNFMRRHPELSLRTPESTSIARACGFNRPQVQLFFDNLNNIRQKYLFDVDNIYNVDETGATPQNAISGFKKTGILDGNIDVFSDLDFVPSQVTEKEYDANKAQNLAASNGQSASPSSPIPSCSRHEVAEDTQRNVEHRTPPHSPISLCSLENENHGKENRSSPIPSCSFQSTYENSNYFIPLTAIQPLPIVKQDDSKRKRRTQKSEILTSTPIREELRNQKNKKLPKTKLPDEMKRAKKPSSSNLDQPKLQYPKSPVHKTDPNEENVPRLWRYVWQL
ncbi:unnamed protein product [Acanthoscelides obtectus]|uniref:HTH CENPB-type domain-containing protein n=1 Tax=Acanthoscelides obtectus TaxID=200917 RepID=A0A9P0LJI6_ACAOB|nr:unnamed protein product [Acanthoscelides obtectus]CAK1620779.1 hypothetical protein AOBTE_LOCUS565 [Acanthoscelides obtectus]